MRRRTETLRRLLRVLLGLFFIGAGVVHFTNTEFYTAIMPPYLPWHLALVYVSGACEIAGGVGVFVPRLRRAAGYGLVALLVAVFPANIHMAVNRVTPDGMPVAPALLWLRLPVQFVLIAWVLWCTHEAPTEESDTTAP